MLRVFWTCIETPLPYLKPLALERAEKYKEGSNEIGAAYLIYGCPCTGVFHSNRQGV
jgi:hypothetical protein